MRRPAQGHDDRRAQLETLADEVARMILGVEFDATNLIEADLVREGQAIWTDWSDKRATRQSMQHARRVYASRS